MTSLKLKLTETTTLPERCHQSNIELNAKKLQTKEVRFVGTVIFDQGQKPDPDKVAAIS